MRPSTLLISLLALGTACSARQRVGLVDVDAGTPKNEDARVDVSEPDAAADGLNADSPLELDATLNPSDAATDAPDASSMEDDAGSLCEADLLNDLENCGRCGNVCTTPYCIGGICRSTNTTVSRVRINSYHSCFTSADGLVYCWGMNSAGQLGVPSAGNRNTPTLASMLSGIIADTGAGANSTCVLREDGDVSCFGDNGFGQLGVAATGGPTPYVVPGLWETIALAVGDFHVCALRDDHTLRCWGFEGANGRTTSSYVPAEITGLSDVESAASGWMHSCAVYSGGEVACWGRNSESQLGDGTSTFSATPVQVVGISNAIQVSAGNSHSCALDATNTAWCWGQNNHGQLGDGTTTNHATPVQVLLENITRIEAAGSHTCALSLGQVYCWGWGDFGQIGDGNYLDRHLPTAATGMNGVVDLSSHGLHNCALKDDGTLWCWGENNFGELGPGVATSSSTSLPVEVPLP